MLDYLYYHFDYSSNFYFLLEKYLKFWEKYIFI